jgi:hypothetical protein
MWNEVRQIADKWWSARLTKYGQRRHMILEELKGKQKVRILTGVVAGRKPRAEGDVVELPSMECLQLIAQGAAEPYVAEPTFQSS